MIQDFLLICHTNFDLPTQTLSFSLTLHTIHYTLTHTFQIDRWYNTFFSLSKNLFLTPPLSCRKKHFHHIDLTWVHLSNAINFQPMTMTWRSIRKKKRRKKKKWMYPWQQVCWRIHMIAHSGLRKRRFSAKRKAIHEEQGCETNLTLEAILSTKYSLSGRAKSCSNEVNGKLCLHKTELVLVCFCPDSTIFPKPWGERETEHKHISFPLLAWRKTTDSAPPE